MPPVLLTEAVRLRHIFVFVVLAAVLSAVSSCRDDGRARVVLRLADSLMEERPDSALALLRRDSLLFGSAGKSVCMAYELSKSEAEDKCYILHTSDSAMLPVAEYFARRGTPLQRVRAWYALGRVYCDLRLYGHALSAFDNALAADDGGDPAVCRYKSRACTWVGYVYEKKLLYNKVLSYSKLAYEYAKRADVPIVKVYALRDIGRSYSYLKKNDVAIPYYISAAKVAKAMDDAYLYSVVMEELAGIYQEEGRLDDTRKALSVPFYGENNVDFRAHYAIWAGYYAGIGCLDSAIIYNQKALAYAEPEIKMDINQDLARLYRKMGRYADALKCYVADSAYADTIARNEAIETADLLSHVECLLDVERENTALEKTKLRLTLMLSVLVIGIVIASFAIARYYTNAKRRVREQQARVEAYLRQRDEREAQTVKRNEERISRLENELSSSNEELSSLRMKLMRNEAEMLANRNEQMQLRMIHRELLQADFVETDVYKLYHDVLSSPTSADYHKLKAALDTAYDNFTQRLREFYPGITENEMWFCCMIKTGLTSKEICLKSVYNKHSLGMAKHRLYGKMFHKNGSSTDLDNFIKDF